MHLLDEEIPFGAIDMRRILKLFALCGFGDTGSESDQHKDKSPGYGLWILPSFSIMLAHVIRNIEKRSA